MQLLHKKKKQRTRVPIGVPKCFNDSYTWETMIRIAYSRYHCPRGILLNMFRQINYTTYIFLLLDQRYMQVSKVYQLALRSLLNNLSKIILCKISVGGLELCYTGPGLLTLEKCRPRLQMNDNITYTLYNFGQTVAHYRQINQFDNINEKIISIIQY